LLQGDLPFRTLKGQPGVSLADPVRDVYHNKYGPGVALLRLPVMAFLVDRHPGAELISPAEHLANQIYSALVLLLACALCVHTCYLLRIGTVDASLAVATVAFGAGLFHYGTYDAFLSHIYSALGVAILVWLGVRAEMHGRPLSPLAIGVTCFFLVLIRNTNVVVLAALVAAFLFSKWRRGSLDIGASNRRTLLGLLCGTAAGVILQIAYNSYAFGHLVFFQYGGETFLWHRPMQLAVLCSYERGLFTYYPIFAVVLVALWIPRGSRLLAGWFTLLVLAYTTIYGFWACWFLGGGFGHRGFVELVPIAVILFAVGLSKLPKSLVPYTRAAAVLCALLTLQFMVGYWMGSLPFDGTTRSVYWSHIWGPGSIPARIDALLQ
jgi:hypothetical protein